MDANPRLGHLGLSAAAATIYYRVAGKVAPRDAREWSAALDSIATAVSRIVPVFAPDEQGVPRALTAPELEGVRFRRGGTALVLADGRELRHPTIRLQDLATAISVLRSAGVPTEKSPE